MILDVCRYDLSSQTFYSILGLFLAKKLHLAPWVTQGRGESAVSVSHLLGIKTFVRAEMRDHLVHRAEGSYV